MKPLRLSVLDQSPVPAGASAADAIRNTISLARHVDALGYERLWLSEHHSMQTLASTAPELLLARLGAETRQIRLGSGGVMLPHYTALKVAETFRTLEALYPGRIDLGLGRAPGGGPIESAALRRTRNVPQADDFPEQLSELLAFLHGGFGAEHPFSRIRVMPEGPHTPDVWLLGSSMWSAEAAAAYGLPYAFAHFFSGDSTRAAVEWYRAHFQVNATLGDRTRSMPESLAAVGAIVADTQAEADRLATSVRLLQQRIRMGDRSPVAAPEDALRELARLGPQPPDTGEFPRVFVGTPERVCAGLQAMAEALKLDGLIVNTIVHDHAARLRSYSLLAEAFELNPV